MRAISVPQFTDEETELVRHSAVLRGHVGVHAFQQAALVMVTRGSAPGGFHCCTV